MSQIQLNLAEMQQLAQNLVVKAQQAMDQLNTLANQADPSTVWTGEAASAYKNAFDTWHRAQNQAQQALEQLGRAVTTITNNFSAVQAGGVQAFNGFFS